MTKKKKLVVLCLNDFPIGVYTSSEKADAAAETDKAERTRHAHHRLYYHMHEFVVDEEGRL